MFNTADNQFHFSRRETLRTVGAAATAPAIGTTAVGRPVRLKLQREPCMLPPAMQPACGRTAHGWR